ncbi:MAG: hypothetical protein AYK19_21025 [Theionarchaea archaeon DG-70-1]|nr:MAG: hypothetical protein AYK19_21025 [Theionarchaea archaeon DG-70-1]
MKCKNEKARMKIISSLLVIGLLFSSTGFPLLTGETVGAERQDFPQIKMLCDRYHYITADPWGKWFEDNYPGELTVSYLMGPLTYEELINYDIFITYLSWKSSLGPRPTASEVEALEQYVRDGGGVMLMGDDLYWGLWTNEYCNILSEPFNVYFNDDQLLDPTNYDITVTRPEDDYERHIVFHNIAEHPTTVGVTNVWAHGTCSLIVNNPDAVIVVAGDDDTYSDRHPGYPQGSYPPAVVALEHGSGRILFSGGAVSYGADVYDNRIFIWNILKWLVGYDAQAQWTFMVYMDGDNNLDGAAIDDLNEMEFVGSSANVNIVVQIDRILGYDDSNEDWTTTRRYYVTKDPNGYDGDNDSLAGTIFSTLIQDLGEQNMGNAQTLVDFVNWAMPTYPAQNYALILWDHGRGWKFPATPVKGVCEDWTSWDVLPDLLTQPEIRWALSQVTSDGANKLEIVGFDACLMGMLEIDYDIMSYADYRVGSEEVEPWDGWDYQASLSALVTTPGMTPSQLATQIVNDYMNFYGFGGNETQSAVDLSKIQALVTATDTFARDLWYKIATYCPHVSSARANSEFYDDPDYIDFFHFAQLINSAISDPLIQTNAQNVMNAITNAVVAEGHGALHPNSHGISIYYPLTLAGYLPRYETDVLLSATTNWDEFIKGSYTCTPPPPAALSSSISASPTQVSSGQQITVTLNVQNTGGTQADNVTPSSLAVSTTGTATATYLSGPTPVSANILPSNSQNFVWTYISSSGANGGTVSFTGNASGTDAGTGNSVSSLVTTSNTATVQVPASINANLTTDLSIVSSGQNVTVNMIISNTGQAAANNVTPSPLAVNTTGTVSATHVSGPVPGLHNIPGGLSQTFTWIYTCSGTNGGTVTFSGNASGTDANSGNTIVSNTASATVTVQTPANLVSSIAASPPIAKRGNTIMVIMTVQNTGQAGAVNVTPSPLTVAGTGRVVLISGPVPASTSIPGFSSQTFTWKYKATGNGTVTFSSNASGADVNSGIIVTSPVTTSNSVIIRNPNPRSTNASNTNQQIRSLSQTHIREAEDLIPEIQQLIDEAKAEGKDTAEYEKLLEQAKEALEKAYMYFAGGHYIAANYWAMQAIELLFECKECLENL